MQKEHSAILSTFIKLPFVIKIFVSSIIEWSFYCTYKYKKIFIVTSLFHRIANKIVNKKVVDILGALYGYFFLSLETLFPVLKYYL